MAVVRTQSWQSDQDFDAIVGSIEQIRSNQAKKLWPPTKDLLTYIDQHISQRIQQVVDDLLYSEAHNPDAPDGPDYCRLRSKRHRLGTLLLDFQAEMRQLKQEPQASRGRSASDPALAASGTRSSSRGAASSGQTQQRSPSLLAPSLHSP